MYFIILDLLGVREMRGLLEEWGLQWVRKVRALEWLGAVCGEGARVVGYGDGVRALEWWLIGHQPLEDSMDELDRMERERNAKWRKIMGTTSP